MCHPFLKVTLGRDLPKTVQNYDFTFCLACLMCHQVTCNVEFNCKLVHFILYFHKHPQLDTLLNFLFSEQYSFYSTNSHYLKKEMHFELIVCLCSVKVVAIPNVGHHRLSPPISVHCSSEFVLMKKFICSLMDACTVSPRFLRT